MGCVASTVECEMERQAPQTDAHDDVSAPMTGPPL
jgi:hypothetical protein